jgi:hypothetical protein
MRTERAGAQALVQRLDLFNAQRWHQEDMTARRQRIAVGDRAGDFDPKRSPSGDDLLHFGSERRRRNRRREREREMRANQEELRIVVLPDRLDPAGIAITESRIREDRM